MKLKDILEYTLIETGDYTLSIYHVLVSLFIVGVAKLSLIFLKRIFRKQEQRKNLEIGKSRAIYQLINYIVWVSVVTLILESLGIKITFLLASSAALLVGIGLGLQQIFQDFLSGVTLLVEGTLKVGDIIEIADGEIGQVKEMNLRTSKLETRDNIILIVPNSKLINDIVINWSHTAKTTRFGIAIGVAYGSDVDKVTDLLLNCLNDIPEIVKKPAPTVLFKDFGNSSLDFELLFYTNNTFRVERLKSTIRYKIDKTFRENNITIPFPQRDVHFYPNKD